MRITTLFSLAFMLVLVPTLVLADAGTAIDQSRPLTADGSITISNIAGKVTVRGWDRAQVKITGTLGDGAQPLHIEGNNHALSVEVKARDSGSHGWFHWGSNSQMGPTVLNVRVPRGAKVSIHTVSASARASDLDGGRINVETVSGQVHLAVNTPKLDVTTVSGDIELAGTAQAVAMETVSGNVVAPDLGREARIETVSGDMTLKGGPFRNLDASSVSGDLDIVGGVTASGELSAHSTSGDVRLALPATTSAKLHAETFSGDIRSMTGTPVTADYGPGSSLRSNMGTGSATIDLKSFSGDIDIRAAQETSG